MLIVNKTTVVDPETVIGGAFGNNCAQSARTKFWSCPLNWNHAHIIAVNEIVTIEFNGTWLLCTTKECFCSKIHGRPSFLSWRGVPKLAVRPNVSVNWVLPWSLGWCPGTLGTTPGSTTGLAVLVHDVIGGHGSKGTMKHEIVKGRQIWWLLNEVRELIEVLSTYSPFNWDPPIPCPGILCKLIVYESH